LDVENLPFSPEEKKLSKNFAKFRRLDLGNFWRLLQGFPTVLVPAVVAKDQASLVDCLARSG
jgi:hypothetical protein